MYPGLFRFEPAQVEMGAPGVSIGDVAVVLRVFPSRVSCDHPGIHCNELFCGLANGDSSRECFS